MSVQKVDHYRGIRRCVGLTSVLRSSDPLAGGGQQWAEQALAQPLGQHGIVLDLGQDSAVRLLESGMDKACGGLLQQQRQVGAEVPGFW